MATIKLTGLTNLQARCIFEMIEDGKWDIFNEYLKNNEVNEIDLQDTNQHVNEDGDSEYTIEFCDVEDEEVEDEDGPGYEPEDCECKDEMEKDGIEYTQDFTPSDDKTTWICDHCGRHQ
jgi:hypothetical protein